MMAAGGHRQELSLTHRVVLSMALFFGGVGGFLLAGYLVIAVLTF